MAGNTAKLTLISFTISLACNFQNGFSSTYLNTPVDEFKDFLNTSLAKRGIEMNDRTYDWIWNLIANIWFAGFFVGTLLSPVMTERLGRKLTFIIMNIVSLAASILRFLAIIFYSPETLFVGRILASLATSVTFQCLILCLQECSPTKLRGAMSFTSEISYSLTSLLGTFLGMDFVFGSNLRLLLGFAIIPSTIAILVLIPMHETPKFLYISKNNPKAAEKSIHFYHGSKVDAQSVLREITLESQQDSEASMSIKEVFRTPHLRKALFLSVLVTQNSIAQMSMQISSTKFLEDVNVETSVAQWTSTVMALVYFGGTIIGFLIIERIGRRTMFLSFASINAVSILAYVIFAGLQPMLDWMKYGCLASFIVYDLAYGIGVGPIAWFFCSELVPQRHRSIVQSLCFGINTIMIVIATFTVLPLFNAIKAYAFLILYVIPSFICLFILFRHLPETKGREIHEIVDELKGFNKP